MRFALIVKTFRDRWRSAVLWALGLAGFATVQLYIYPSVQDTAAEMDSFIASFPEVFSTIFRIDDYSSGPGFLGTELFSLMVPLIMISVGSSWGAAAAAEEEEKGTADVLYTLPLRRETILMNKLIATVLVLIAQAVVTFTTIRVGSSIVNLSVGTNVLVAVVVSCLMLGMLFAGLSLFVGALTGRRGVAVGASIALALVAFVFYSLAPLVDTFDAILPFNPFQWALGEDPLRNGWDWTGLGWLTLSSLTLFSAAIFTVGRRDINT
jgi:ABC-2 type transport system permease protein